MSLSRHKGRHKVDSNPSQANIESNIEINYWLHNDKPC